MCAPPSIVTPLAEWPLPQAWADALPGRADQASDILWKIDHEGSGETRHKRSESEWLT